MKEVADNAECAATPADKCPSTKCLDRMSALKVRYPDCLSGGISKRDKFARSIKDYRTTIEYLIGSSTSASTSLTAVVM